MGKGHRAGVQGVLKGGVAIALLCVILAFPAAPQVIAQQQNGISEPESGAVLSGMVSIQGTATHEQFLRYELAFSNGSDWLVFAEGQRPVVNGTLAVWDTTIGQPSNPVFPDGVYRLRLRVVRQDYNYDEYFVNNLILSNAMTPTPTETVAGDEALTPVSGTVAPAVTATSGFIIIRPTPLPSLTPFPTPSIPAAPGALARGTPVSPDLDSATPSGGLLQRFLNIETEPFGRAFWTGVQLSLLAFVLLAIYVAVRAILRFFWPRFWAYMNRRE